MKAPARKSQLDQLERELRTALSRQTKNIIEIGKLLIKSQELIKTELIEVDWLDWLRDHFDLSQRTAYNYCAAARYEDLKGKIATVANLAPGLLYDLAAGNEYNEEQETAILAATHKGRVDQTRADEICQALVPPDSEEPDEEVEEPEEAADKEDPDEIKKIIEGPPPDVPPPAPIAPPINFALRTFDEVIAKLKPLVTKPAVQFVTTTHSTDDLEMVLVLIQNVLDETKRKAIGANREQNRTAESL
jgi:hypothetical protein